jgi:hypothetical protein
VPTFEGAGLAKGRAILEASDYGLRRVSWRTESRRLGGDSIVVPTEQPLGALAVYLCEPESDDGLFENGLLTTPPAGGTFEVLRLVP